MDFYIVLGVQRGRDGRRHQARVPAARAPSITRTSTRAIARPTARFRRIAEAYETLDRSGAAPALRPPGGRPRPPDAPRSFDGFDFSAMRRTDPQRRDIRRAVRGRVPAPRRAATSRERGADLHASVDARFEERMRGARTPLTVTRQEACSPAAAPAMIVRPRRGASPATASGSVRWARGHMVFAQAPVRPAAERTAAAPAVRRVRRAGDDGAHRGDRACGFPRASPTALGCGFRARATRAARRTRRRLSSTCEVDAASAVRARAGTICTSSCRWRSRSGARRPHRGAGAPTARRRCGCRRARRRDSGSACAGAACPSPRGGRPWRPGRRGPADAAVPCIDERSKELLREFGRHQSGERPEGLVDLGSHGQEDRQGVLHDQRRGAEVQHPPADAAAVRARRTAQAVAHGRQHAPVLGRGSRAARDDSVAHARPWRQPGRRRDHPQHAAEDRADAARGQRVHGLREARARARHRRLGAAPRHGARQVGPDRYRPQAGASGQLRRKSDATTEVRRRRQTTHDRRQSSSIIRSMRRTEEATDALGAYLRALAKLPQLTPDEERALARRTRTAATKTPSSASSSQPALRRQLRQALPDIRRPFPRSDPRRQPRADRGGAAVRSVAQRQVHHVRASGGSAQAILHLLTDETRVAAARRCRSTRRCVGGSDATGARAVGAARAGNRAAGRGRDSLRRDVAGVRSARRSRISTRRSARSCALRFGLGRHNDSPHAAGNRRPAAPDAREGPPDRSAREGKAAAVPPGDGASTTVLH